MSSSYNPTPNNPNYPFMHHQRCLNTIWDHGSITVNHKKDECEKNKTKPNVHIVYFIMYVKNLKTEWGPNSKITVLLDAVGRSYASQGLKENQWNALCFLLLSGHACKLYTANKTNCLLKNV